MRYCKGCQQNLLETEFYTGARHKFSWRCKECCKALGRAKRTRLLGRPPKHPCITFAGIRYYLRESGYYISGKNKRLHRAVWEASYGLIPSGYHIHHADENPANNKLNNLALVTHGVHMIMHADLLVQRELATGIFDVKKMARRGANRRYRLKKKALASP